MITALSPLASTTQDTSAQQTLTSDFDSFLTMLTTQLQNQDPLSPLDSTEFTNQLVQFSQLEQQINQSGKIDDLIALQKSSESANALSYIGNEVEMISPVIALKNGSTTFAYDLPSDAKSAKITIFDEDGNIVRSLTGETSAGRHEVTWDGTNDSDAQLSDGTYSILVSAKDENEDPLTDINVYARGTAEEVITDSGTTYLRVGEVYVPLDRIVSIGPLADATSSN